MTTKRVGTGAASTATVLVSIAAVVLLAGAYVSFTMGGATQSQTTSATTTSAGMEGVVTGFVTVGPSQPVCSENKSCNVDMTGYSIVFTPQCAVSALNCKALTASLSPAGHYSILLPEGTYTVTGLNPSCSWVGCSSAFPKTVAVEGGMQLVLNFEIDTGIR